jgi:putative GTP pyrophosphokinase
VIQVAGYSKSRVDRAGRLLGGKVGVVTVGDIEDSVEIVDWWRAEHVRPLSVVSANLFRYVTAEGHPVITQRVKRLPTVLDKLRREDGMRLSQMEDIGGVRAVLPDQDAAYRVARRLRRNWTITRFRDYVAEPKADGYRALHLINRNRGRLVEIQLRTPNQDRWANVVEGAMQKNPGLKSGGGPPRTRELLAIASEGFAIADGSVPPTMSRVREMQEALKGADTFTLETRDDP